MWLLYFCFYPFFSVYDFNFRYTLLPRLILYYCIYQRTFSCKYNPSRRLNVCSMKSKNIRLHFIASSFWSSISYLSCLRAIIYCSNNTSLLVIIMHGLPISNVFIFLRWRSYTFLLLNFCKPVWILNTSKIQKDLSLTSANQMRIVFWKLQHTKQWVIISVSIYTLNSEKYSFSKRGRRGMINLWRDQVEPSSFIYCK